MAERVNCRCRGWGQNLTFLGIFSALSLSGIVFPFLLAHSHLIPFTWWYGHLRGHPSFNDSLLSLTLSTLRHPIISASLLSHLSLPATHIFIPFRICQYCRYFALKFMLLHPRKRNEHPLTTFHTCLDCFYAISQPSDRLICSNDMPAFSYRCARRLGVVLIILWQQLHGYLKQDMRRKSRDNKIGCRLTIRST